MQPVGNSPFTEVTQSRFPVGKVTHHLLSESRWQRQPIKAEEPLEKLSSVGFNVETGLPNSTSVRRSVAAELIEE